MLLFVLDCQSIRAFIHGKLCGADPYPVILCDFEKVLKRFLLRDTSDNDVTTVADVYTHVQKLIFSGLDSSLQHLLIELIGILDVGAVSECMTNLFLKSTGDIFNEVHWSNLLAVVSTLAVAVKGGVFTVKSLIHRILNAVFQSPFESGSQQLDFLQLDDGLFTTEDQEATEFTPRDFQLFCSALLIARQLCLEDVRITGITYSQWWTETFCSASSLGSHSVLQSQADIVLLADMLLELLPWENDPRLLSIQLTNQPSRCVVLAAKKAAPKTITSHFTWTSGAQTDAFDMAGSVFGADTLFELHSFDTVYAATCFQRWNDYVEIGRGRLAELRHGGSERKTTYSGPSSVGTPKHCTPGWEEIYEWIADIAHQMANRGTGKSDLRLPPSLMEATLFRPRYLRETLIPAVLYAPELRELPEELNAAHLQLLNCIKRQEIEQSAAHTPRIRIKLDSNQRSHAGRLPKEPRDSLSKRRKTTG